MQSALGAVASAASQAPQGASSSQQPSQGASSSQQQDSQSQQQQGQQLEGQQGHAIGAPPAASQSTAAERMLQSFLDAHPEITELEDATPDNHNCLHLAIEDDGDPHQCDNN